VKLPPLLVYTVLRLLAFLVPLALLMIFPIFREQFWLAGIFAALIGLSLSVLFLRKPLAEVSEALAERRERARADIYAEDDADEEAG
jgi:hypothetical protein